MPESVQPAATLLSISAPKATRNESARGAADFSAELASAVEDASAPSTTAAAKEPAAPPAKDATSAPAASDGQSAERPTAADDSAAADTTESDAAEVDAQESELLATFVVTETIVLETPPDAVLPESAVTSIDVDATATFDVAPSGVGPTGAATGAIDQASGQAPDAGVVPPTAAALPTPALETSGADAATSAADADAGVLTGAAVPSVEGDASDVPLGKKVASPDETELAPSDPTDTEKASLKHHHAEPLPPADAGATAAAALAVAAAPHASARDADELQPTEATDKVDATLAEGPSSRDSARAEAADKATATDRPTLDPARFVSRVSRAIETAAERGGPVEIRLSPPELGSLQVKIQVKDGAMTAKLEVETPAVRNAVLDNLPALRDRLEQQQIRIDKFDVEVRDQGQRGGDWRQQQDQRQQADAQQPRSEARPQRQASALGAATIDPRTTRTNPYANNGINLVV